MTSAGCCACAPASAGSSAMISSGATPSASIGISSSGVGSGKAGSVAPSCACKACNSWSRNSISRRLSDRSASSSSIRPCISAASPVASADAPSAAMRGGVSLTSPGSGGGTRRRRGLSSAPLFHSLFWRCTSELASLRPRRSTSAASGTRKIIPAFSRLIFPTNASGLAR